MNACADAIHETLDDGSITQSMHTGEHPVIDMLERHIDILDDLFFPCIQIKEIIGDLLRIEVKGPDPVQAIHLDQFTKKRQEPLAKAKVDTIVDGVLGNEVDLFNSFRSEPASFGHDRVYRSTALFPAHQGDRAECTISIAAFSDFHIGTVLRTESQPRG